MSTICDPRVYVEFDDRLNQHVRIQTAALAAEPAVWLHCEGGDGPNDPRPLLNVEQARRMRDALDLFLAEHDGAHVPAGVHATRVPRPVGRRRTRGRVPAFAD